MAGRQRLSYKLTRLCMLCALAIGIVLSMVQIGIDGVRESARIDERMASSLAVIGESAAEAAYNIDDELAQRVVDGLASIDGVVAVEISLPNRPLAVRMSDTPHSSARWLTDAMFEPRRQYVRPLHAGGQSAPIGQLKVMLDTSIAGSDFVSRSIFVVASGLIRAALLAALLMGLFYWLLTRPLSRLSAALAEVDPEAPERVRLEVPAHHRDDEFGHWVASVNGLLESIRRNLSARAQAENQAAFLRQFDALTSLPNRALFADRVSQRLEQMQRGSGEIAVMFCDIVGFQHLNDAHGFSFGDRVLAECAGRIRQQLREGDQAARISADRFALMCEIDEGAAGALQIAESLRLRLQAEMTIEGERLQLAFRFGLSLFPADAGAADTLIKNAESALSLAKAPGHSGIQFYESRAGDEIRVRRRLRGEIEAALHDDEFELHYQPQFDARSGQMVGVEALVRWPLAARERVSTESLIQIAEESGQVVALGEWVLARACRDARTWRDQGLPPLRIALNVSVLQLEYGGFVELIDQTLTEQDWSPRLLELEITETAVMRDVAHVVRHLERIRDRGVQIAVDDFGTGHSSLQYLKRLPINCLKIDRSFIRDLFTDAGDAQIVAAIIGLGRSLKLRVVGEGIEDEDQLRFLQQQGCDEVQGFLFAQPMPAAALAEFAVAGIESRIRNGRQAPLLRSV